MLFFSRTRSFVYGTAYVFFLLAATMYPFRFHFTAEYFQLRIPTINWFPIDLSAGQLDSRRIWADYFINIALFVPFGFLGFKAGSGKSVKWRIFRMILLGLVFSTGIEFTQLFTETRDTTLTDVIFDTTGTGIGALFAAAADQVFGAI